MGTSLVPLARMRHASRQTRQRTRLQAGRARRQVSLRRTRSQQLCMVQTLHFWLALEARGRHGLPSQGMLNQHKLFVSDLLPHVRSEQFMEQGCGLAQGWLDQATVANCFVAQTCLVDISQGCEVVVWSR